MCQRTWPNGGSCGEEFTNVVVFRPEVVIIVAFLMRPTAVDESKKVSQPPLAFEEILHRRSVEFLPRHHGKIQYTKFPESTWRLV